MAMSIDYWDADKFTMVSSRSEYTEVSRIVGLETTGWTAHHIDLTIYLHEPSGLVVHDVAAFEKWLDSIR